MRSRFDARVAGYSIAVLAGMMLSSFMVYLLGRAARSWLVEQPAYYLPFREIVLDPAPPAWYRGDASAFLEDVRRRARMPETFAFLKVQGSELKRIFENNSPWVEEVSEVRYQPFGVTIRLAYRRPVAIVEIKRGKETYLIDSCGVLLPLEDVEKDCGWLKIAGKGLLGPLDPSPGLHWKPKPGAIDAEQGNGRIESAAKLALFLDDKMRSIDRAHIPALDFRIINPTGKNDGDLSLWLWNARKTIVLWGEAPGEETPGHLTAEEKWARLVDWGRRSPMSPPSDDEFWEITARGVERATVPDHPSSESGQVASPRRDRATIPAGGSGQ